jgi:hypothetical protein
MASPPPLSLQNFSKILPMDVELFHAEVLSEGQIYKAKSGAKHPCEKHSRNFLKEIRERVSSSLHV